MPPKHRKGHQEVGNVGTKILKLPRGVLSNEVSVAYFQVASKNLVGMRKMRDDLDPAKECCKNIHN